ncbi:MAG: HAMP domain-containing protein [Gammaproteobacteria bacterium]|nr:HAMP domain-containing protein [Gammaproteobacteria bacterium]
MISPGSLRFQISAALLSLLALFAGTVTYTVYALEQQRNATMVLNLAGRLELAGEQLAMQAMNYQENPPRDYETYHRDVRLYYQDLLAHLDTFDEILMAFSYQEFDTKLTGMQKTLHTDLTPPVREAVSSTVDLWMGYRRDLQEKLGEDEQEPRLEWGAGYIVDHHNELRDSTLELLDSLQDQIGTRLRHIYAINNIVLAAAFVISVLIILMIYLRVLGPLDRAVQGMKRVSSGDFGHQVEPSGNSEIASLTRSFNRLSSRLRALFRLIDRIEQGSDLDGTLRFVLEEFAGLLPMDWVCALFAEKASDQLRMERARDREGEGPVAGARFPCSGTLMEKALKNGVPQHVPNTAEAGRADGGAFFRMLSEQGRRSAIALPFSELTPFPGLLVIASRDLDAYTDEHLELLTNIAHLITHSFGRTVRLVEHERLAAIGEFASGIAHEIRSPLATIGLALDYFRDSDLPPGGVNRAELASQEVQRVSRLLEDILLYAKPLSLEIESADMAPLISEFLETNRDLAGSRGQAFVFDAASGRCEARIDRNRMIQVFQNIARNACEAAPAGGQIGWSLAKTDNGIEVSVCNGGDPIPPETLKRLYEPFFTTKRHGTGLGLGIVKRIVDAHGGSIGVESSGARGTRVTILLPSTTG